MCRAVRKEPIAIRVDGSRSKGMGHIIRMLSVARELVSSGIRCFFITKPFEEGYCLIEKQGFPIYLIDKELESHENSFAVMKRILDSESCRLIIHDIQKTTYTYMNKLKRLGLFTINFDDTGSGAPLADILIDPFVSEDKTTPEIRRFFGPRYLILRDQFTMRSSRKVSSDVRKVCVMPGGTDAGRMMEKVVSWICELPDHYDIYVMAGMSMESSSSALYSDHNNSIFMIRDWDSTPDILRQCDLSITSGGVSMCESCALGVPTLAVAQVEHEISNIEQFSSKQAVLSLGKAQDLRRDVFRDVFVRLEKAARFRQVLSECGRKTVDGLGKKRVVRIIKNFYREIRSSQDMLLKVAVN
ncbi:MAG: hypothetical protein JW928_08300 [Candidatus Aureabacteria bacterium]|nr:hypothetical protein [Candidatus Auribacterota bacterium]